MLMEQKITISNEYASPQTRVILVKPGGCLAQSAKSNSLQDMSRNSVYDEDF